MNSIYDTGRVVGGGWDYDSSDAYGSIPVVSGLLSSSSSEALDPITSSGVVPVPASSPSLNSINSSDPPVILSLDDQQNNNGVSINDGR